MPGEANAFQREINVLKEKLANTKDPAEKAKKQDQIKEREAEMRERFGK